MNARICSYGENNSAKGMGTTVVMLAFGKKGVYLSNVGDSKAFLHNSTGLSQISCDHVVNLSGRSKPPLSQCLGISPDEFVIKPHLAMSEYSALNRYLICSDGLTDMVSPEEIEAIMSEKKPVQETAEALMKTALFNGGTDNITIILCELSKKNFFKRKVLK